MAAIARRREAHGRQRVRSCRARRRTSASRSRRRSSSRRRWQRRGRARPRRRRARARARGRRLLRLRAHRPRRARPARALGLDATALVLVGYLGAVMLDGPALTLAWAAEAVALAEIARRHRDPLARAGALAFLGCAAVHALAILAPASALVVGLEDPVAALALLGVAGAALAAARMPRRRPARAAGDRRGGRALPRLGRARHRVPARSRRPPAGPGAAERHVGAGRRRRAGRGPAARPPRAADRRARAAGRHAREGRALRPLVARLDVPRRRRSSPSACSCSSARSRGSGCGPRPTLSR